MICSFDPKLQQKEILSQPYRKSGVENLPILLCVGLDSQWQKGEGVQLHWMYFVDTNTNRECNPANLLAS
ncbi:hypothetical protein HMPREF0653_01581 [Prevotella disiens JCM 6334 = ATCC 29426]|uniref:Uncharacterized protein n=1 Tax=Prevotella disiens JCM 6334 = ATCC 29426 TaxID=1235811 RepID=A0ABP2Y6I1_9BACT|nr:hypothetical protein HMPREF0653_01581 [Prevotella disiens JCM 6334 = ATCC 29426]